MVKRLKQLRRIGPLVALLLGWQLGSILVGKDSLPSPWRTFHLLLSTASHNEMIYAQGGGPYGFAPHIWSTFWHVAVAATFGAIVGLAYSLLLNLHPAARAAADSFIEFGRTLPPLLLIPFAAAIIAASDWVRFLTIGFYAALTISVYAIQAFSKVPRQYEDMAHLLGSSQTRRVFTVQLPSSIPYLIGPLRWVYSFGLGISVVVEYLAAGSGIGRAMKEVTAYSRADLIVVGVIWTLVLAFIFDGLLLAMLSAGLEWTDRKALLRWISR